MRALLEHVGRPMTCRAAVELVVAAHGLPPIPSSAWEGLEGWAPVRRPVRPCTVASAPTAGHPHVYVLVDPRAGAWATGGRDGFTLLDRPFLGPDTRFLVRSNWP